MSTVSRSSTPQPDRAAPQPAASSLRVALGYALMIATAIGLFLIVRWRGSGLTAGPPQADPFGASGPKAHLEALLHVLIALAVVIVTARAIGALFRRFHQPPVIGEIIAGILLGPSLLGRIAPSVAHFVLPPSVAPFINVLSQVGVILYMFLVGLELDPGLLRRRGHATVAISHASILLPFLLGATMALFVYPRLSTSDVPFTGFALFLGVSMSVTAFPVLARILTDRKIHRTRMGVLTLTCAAVDDVTAWCLLAFVVSVVETRTTGAIVTVMLAGGYIAAMFLGVRPAMVRLSRLYGNRGRLTQGLMATVFVMLLISAMATDLIGIHAVFGAFALGAVIPHDSGLARELTDKLEDLVVVLFLPAFFAFTGMRTQIGLVDGLSNWLLCGLIILVASLGKFGGSALAARLTGLGWRDSAALGVLMNTRGLMELIVLNIGLELKVISPTLFAMLVIMAVVTTFATTPILQRITRGHPLTEEGDADVALAAGAYAGVFLPISNPRDVHAMLELADALSAKDEPPPRVLALVHRPAGGVRSGLRETEGTERPRSPILSEAVNHAREHGLRIDPQVQWTDEPAGDIIRSARAARVGWILLGFHRPVFGDDLFGGVVKAVLDETRRLPVSVGVVIHGHERPLKRIFAVADASDDGQAVLDFAARLACSRASEVHALLVPRGGAEPEPELMAALRVAGRRAGKWLHSDVLAERTPADLAYKTQGDLVIMGASLANELGLPLDHGERCVVIVQGSRAPRSELADTEAA
jgi:Kef-type K+ transport system membrane component KefB